MVPKKYIGLLGLGSETTAYYFKRLNEIYHTIYGGYSTCPIKLLNANFNDINPHLPDGFEAIEKITEDYLMALNDLSVDSIIVPNITLHQTIDRLSLRPEIKDKFIHVLDVLVKRLEDQRIKKVIIFGSKYTMNSSYIPSRLENKGIEILKVTEEDQLFLDQFRTAIYEGKQELSDQKRFEYLIQKYSPKAAILLACTELSIAGENLNTSTLFDLVNLQLEEVIRITLL